MSAEKAELVARLLELLRSDLEIAVAAQSATQRGATHEENKPENDKDTRAIEASYLARGQAQRVEDLRSGLGLTQSMVVRALGPGDRIAIGALVTTEDDAEEASVVQRYLLAPARGGTKLDGGVQVITPSSPLGRALVGKREGDDLEISLASRVRTLSITKVE